MLPDGWNKVLLKDILEGSIRNGYSPNPSEKLTGYWVLGLGALGDDGLNINVIKPVEPNSKTLNSGGIFSLVALIHLIRWGAQYVLKEKLIIALILISLCDSESMRVLSMQIL
jgi:hypothetical protein